MKTVKVTVKAETHRHKGELCEPGQEIEVTPQQAKWLQDRDVIEKVKASSLPPESGD